MVAGDLPVRIAAVGGKTTREELGQQTIEGVTATGTRTTTEIPAGAIGNEQPIRIVSEQWFSPELQVLVLTKHTDPRSGETTYRLTGIVRAEPARSLFDVPADYTLQESAIRRQQQEAGLQGPPPRGTAVGLGLRPDVASRVRHRQTVGRGLQTPPIRRGAVLH